MFHTIIVISVLLKLNFNHEVLKAVFINYCSSTTEILLQVDLTDPVSKYVPATIIVDFFYNFFVEEV